MIDRNNIKKKLNDYGIPYASIGISRGIYESFPSFGNDYSKIYDTVSTRKIETYNIEMLREEDLKYITDALYFYSKSKHPQVEEAKREYIIMRMMMEDNTRNDT